MDLCHCSIPLVKKHLQMPGHFCEVCGLWYDHKEWLKDPRRKLIKTEIDALVDKILYTKK